MINHARTLLLNLEAVNDFQPGEEYVCPQFRQIALPSYLHSIRRVLFGADPDRTTSNYRVRELMTLLHAFCEQHVLAYDSRITYACSSQEVLSHVALIPLANLTDELISAVESCHEELFFGNGVDELAEFEDTWMNASCTLVRLCAVVLAVIKRTDELRCNGAIQNSGCG